jgi:hypothetical protein
MSMENPVYITNRYAGTQEQLNFGLESYDLPYFGPSPTQFFFNLKNAVHGLTNSWV